MSKLFWIGVISLVCFGVLNAQTKKSDLLNQRDKILKDIQLTNRLIESTKKKKGNTIQSVRLINKKINNRKKLIESYSAEIRIIERKIEDRELSIRQLKLELVKQKDLYADILRYSYKNHNYYTKAVYLLASESLNQFYQRKKYLEQLNKARKTKVRLIENLEYEVGLEIGKLNEEKLEMSDALLLAKKEKNALSGERVSRQGVVNNLAQEEAKLRKELKSKIKKELELSKRIESIIRAEAKENTFAKLTPEQRLVSEDFERNKGKLPWPTRQGVITEKFGQHYHPVIKGVKINNNGIDISTLERSTVRTIFSGEVSKIFAIKGSNYTVIVRHGRYYTVYHNLEDVKVSVGEQVSTKQVIGNVGKDKINSNSIVHFEVWKGLDKLNPEDWISN